MVENPPDEFLSTLVRGSALPQTPHSIVVGVDKDIAEQKLASLGIAAHLRWTHDGLVADFPSEHDRALFALAG